MSQIIFNVELAEINRLFLLTLELFSPFQKPERIYAIPIILKVE